MASASGLKCLVTAKLKHAKSGQYMSESDIIYKICCVNDDLWCAVENAIHVYNRNCIKIKEIEHEKIENAVGLTYTVSKDIIVACCKHGGLLQLDSSGSYQSQLAEGDFADVCSYNGKLYALECKKCSICVFECHNNTWVKTKEFKLTFSNGSGADRICVNETGIYVSSLLNHGIFIYNHEGQMQKQIGERGEGPAGRLQYPRLCALDKEGGALVADTDNHRLQLYDSSGSGKWHIIPLYQGMDSPIHALVDGSMDNVWVAIGNRELIKYSRI